MILLNKLSREHGVKPATARAAVRRGYLKAQLIDTGLGFKVWKTTAEEFSAWQNTSRFHEIFGYMRKTW